MKDVGIYIGGIGTGFTTWLGLGNLMVFSWWQLILIGFYIMAMAMVGAFGGMLFQDAILKFVHRWTGKKKQQKQYL